MNLDAWFYMRMDVLNKKKKRKLNGLERWNYAASTKTKRTKLQNRNMHDFQVIRCRPSSYNTALVRGRCVLCVPVHMNMYCLYSIKIYIDSFFCLLCLHRSARGLHGISCVRSVDSLGMCNVNVSIAILSTQKSEWEASKTTGHSFDGGAKRVCLNDKHLMANKEDKIGI